MKADQWKWLCTTLGAVLLTVLGAWWSLGDSVTRPEMETYVAQHSPWVHARAVVTSDMSNLKTQVDRLVSAQNELIVEQRVLVTKFDAYLERESK